MKNIEEQAQLKMKQKKDEFLLLLLQFQDDPNIQLFNPSSSLQLQQFIHAPYKVVTPAKRLNNLDYTDDELNLIRES